MMTRIQRLVLALALLALAPGAAAAPPADPPPDEGLEHLWAVADEIAGRVEALLALATRDVRQGLPAPALVRYRTLVGELRRERAVLEALARREPDDDARGEALQRLALAELRLQRADEMVVVLRVAARRR